MKVMQLAAEAYSRGNESICAKLLDDLKFREGETSVSPVIIAQLAQS